MATEPETQSRSARLAQRFSQIDTPVPASPPKAAMHLQPSADEPSEPVGEGARKKRPLFEERNVRVTYWIPGDVRAAVKNAAESQDMSITEWVTTALRQALPDD